MAATLQRGHIIEDEGVVLTQRSTLNFTGAGVTATDAGGKTVVDIPAGSGGTVESVTAADASVVVEGTAVDPEVRTGTLDAIAAAQPAVASVSLNGQKVTGLGTPTVATDAVTKAYADAIATGLNVKPAVKAATTANVTLSGEQTIDGVALVATDRVLVKNQTLGQNNGIYVVSAGAWSRSTDADTSAEVTAGMFTFLEGGTTQGDTGWVLATNNPITLDTTVLVFTQFSGTGSGIPQTIVDAKGDLIAATAADTVARLPVGANRLALIADSAQTSGMRWGSLVGVTTREWYVDAAAAAGGNGRSAATAFTTFAAALASAQSHDVIYVLSDLNEDIVVNKALLTVLGVGQPIIYGSGSASIAARTVNITARDCRFENFQIRGHATFKGVLLALNAESDGFMVKNVRVDGTVNATPATFYPTSSAAGTGVGGVGLLLHHAELGYIENFYYVNCSIGIVCGTWSTGNLFNKLRGSQNCQDLVVGMNTGSRLAAASTSAWPYAAGTGEDIQYGSCTFINYRPVNAVGATGTTPPSIDLLGDGTSNFAGSYGGHNVFIQFDGIESGGTPVFRVGTAGNTFDSLTIAAGTELRLQGQRNDFRLLKLTGAVCRLASDRNVFDSSLMESNAFFQGAGHFCTFRNTQFTGVLLLTGNVHTFEGCFFSVGNTLSGLGVGPSVTGFQGIFARTYGPTVTVYDQPDIQSITVTNGTAFAIPNPTSALNDGGVAIMSSKPITLDILNSSGGAMGAITWGAKFALAGAFTNPASTKRRTITFYYNPTSDKWVEINRAAADI